jgi:polyisoprenoid-binding protein YceI
MTTTTSVPETLSPGTYRIDEERCLITFRTRHLFGLGPVRGTFRLRSGEIRVAEQLQDSAVRATVDAESFHTGNPARDGTVRSARLLDTTGHPIFTFTSTEVTESGGRWVVRGRLVVRDAEHPVELAIERARADGKQLTIVASAGIDRYAFGVTAMKGLAARRLTCQLEIVATRKEREADGR